MILLLYLLILSVLKLKKRTAIILSFLPLAIISATRSASVGNDAYQYTQLFNYYSSISWSEIFGQGIEPGFIIFSKLISYLSKNSQWFFMTTSFLIIYLVAKIVYNDSKDIIFSAFIFTSYYFYFYSFSAIRQYIAIGFAINAFYYFKEKRTIKAIIYFVLSLSFHYTALILTPVIILLNLKMNKKNIAVFALVSILIGTMFRLIIVNIIMRFDRFSYYRYSIDNFVGRGWDINIVLYIFILIMIVLGIYILKRDTKFETSLFIKKIGYNNDYYDIYSYLICMMMTLSLYMVSVSLTMAARASHYYAIFIIIYIPLILSRMTNSNQIVIRTVIKFMLFVYAVLMLSRNNYYVVPFSFGF